MKKSVSVIIPVFNRLENFKSAVLSVIEQTFNNFELIVVDDGSDPHYGDGINGFLDQLKDTRIKLIVNNSNQGVSSARNIGILESNGDNIAFLDSDDQWIRNKLKIQTDYFRDNPLIRVVHTEEIWVRNGVRVNQKKIHKKSGGDIFKGSLERCLISPSAVMLRKDIFNDYGYFDTNLPACEDYDLWLRITAFEQVGFIEDPMIIKFGGHFDQLSTKYPAMDIFRCRSLMSVINNIHIDYKRRCMALEVFNRKSEILYQGAVKRGNNLIIDEIIKLRESIIGNL